VKVQRTVDQYLQDIVDWGERAMRHASAMTRDQFTSDEKSQDAVTSCISNVGEAANKAVKLEPAITAGIQNSKQTRHTRQETFCRTTISESIRPCSGQRSPVDSEIRRGRKAHHRRTEAGIDSAFR
jgi:hypothetical protein